MNVSPKHFNLSNERENEYINNYISLGIGKPWWLHLPSEQNALMDCGHLV